MAAPPRRSYGEQDLAEYAGRMADLRVDLRPPDAAGAFVAYTDGACFGNPRGPGGWAAVVELERDGVTESWQLWGHLSSTSNNRAEALGILAALEWVPTGSRLTVYSDSQLSVMVFEGKWKGRANADIWELIKKTPQEKRLDVEARWVRGHAGDPGNEQADRLSKLGAANGRVDLVDAMVAAPVTPRRKAKAAPPELEGLAPVGDWERGFLDSVAEQLGRGRSLSPKQQAIVDRIRGRGGSS